MSFFSQYPEFVENDTRKDRGYSRVTIESLDKRHKAMAPDWLVDGMTVLDLGSCLGATGQWVLSQGCKHYTGVEVQPQMAATSRELLGKYWSSDKFSIVERDIREFLDNEIAAGKKYDVVVMIGVIYAFLDTYGFLERVAKVCDYSIVADSIYPWPMISPDIAIIDVIKKQHINSSDANTAFSGAGSRPSPNAMKIILGSLGFQSKEGLIYPEQLEDKTVHDSYSTLVNRPGPTTYPLPSRYMLRFYKTEKSGVRQVGDLVKANINAAKERMKDMPNVMPVDKHWVFDGSVANRFQQEAETHIPDYNRVIDLCIDYTSKVFKSKKDIKVIDVGSALGNTMDKFIQRGYTDVVGVDNSQAMVDRSKYPELVTVSNTLPQGSYNVVLANWTLHFVQERAQYIQDIYDNLQTGGFVIISDKMDHSMETEEMYYDFKRTNGVPEEVIQQKKKALIGVLTTKPLKWYLETLESAGFSDIQVINSRYMFSTIYARKY